MALDLKLAEQAIKDRKVYKATLKTENTRVCVTLEAQDIRLGRHTVLGLCLSAKDIITGRSGDELYFPETDDEALDEFKGFLAMLPEKVAIINGHFAK